MAVLAFVIGVVVAALVIFAAIVSMLQDCERLLRGGR